MQIHNHTSEMLIRVLGSTTVLLWVCEVLVKLQWYQ